jgi:NAD(P)-dependent dehydrogenase (short-subunit alcohol dehydrogenase family)
VTRHALAGTPAEVPAAEPWSRPDRRLRGKVALVVGGGATGKDPSHPGTGEATAILMAAEGARVLVLGRTELHTKATVDRIVADGGDAIAVIADATVEDDCRRAVELAVDRFGGLDVIVNNVGAFVPGGVVELTQQRWDDGLRLNLAPVLLSGRYGVPRLIDRGGGSIINVSSVAALGGSGHAAYGTAKAGVIGLTREMAVDLGRHGVRVNCIVPGHLSTPMGSAAGGEQADRLRRRLSVLGREGTGWDVGWAAVFLASDESRYITGCALPVDGGVTTELLISAFARVRASEPDD